MLRVLALVIGLLLPGLALAQATPEASPPMPDRSATGGAQTLEDILARQRGEPVATRARESDGAAGEAAAIAAQLGIRGQASDAELWEALRFNTATVSTQARGPASAVLVQDDGMAWLTFRSGPLKVWGGIALLATVGLLAVFYLIRGKIRIDGPRTGQTIERFAAFERFSHWLLAGSFILLGITGLITLFGRIAFIPLFGHEAFSPIAIGSKWVHNNVSWAFMAALVIVFCLWVIHNLPNRHDLVWIAKGGGLFVKGVHPPAKKFNAGQKMIFWSVIVLGGSVSASGLSLLFPFEMPMFAKTFAAMNGLGLPGLVGMDPLPTTLTPHAEMQLATAWHAIVAFAMMVIVIAHIYIGSVGMEGAYDAMGSGQVELQWAKEHHGLWVEELQEKAAAKTAAAPAE